MTLQTLTAALALALALAPVAAADTPVPSTMSFVARLADSGVPVTGAHTFQLDLFDAATGGTSKWTETHAAVIVPPDGVLFLELGTQVPLDATIFDGTPRFLQLSIDGVAADSRVVVGSAPYAIRAGTCATATTATTAANATQLASHPVTDFQLRIATGCPAGSSIQTVNADGTVTCETDQDTKFTAGPGLVLMGTAFSIDSTIAQLRVGGTCATGKYIQAIAADGTVTCGTDANTVFTAGTGLKLTGTAFSVDETVIQARVTGTCAAGTAATAVNADGTVTCAALVQNQSAVAQAASVFIAGVLRTTGLARAGSETGGTDAPATNLADYGGVVTRRLVSSTQTAGSIFARTDVLELTRGATAPQINITYPTSPLGVAASVDCWGTDINGGALSASLSLGISESCPAPPCSQTVFAAALNAQGLTCIFGSIGHTTSVTMHRSANVWTGFLTSDFNQ